MWNYFDKSSLFYNKIKHKKGLGEKKIINIKRQGGVFTSFLKDADNSKWTYYRKKLIDYVCIYMYIYLYMDTVHMYYNKCL